MSSYTYSRVAILQLAEKNTKSVLIDNMQNKTFIQGQFSSESDKATR